MNPTKISIWIIIILVAMFIISLLVSGSISKKTTISIVEQSIVVIDLSNIYPEIVKYEFNPFTFKKQISFPKLIFAIHSAALDNDVDALLLKNTSILGLSKTWELSQALQSFQKAEKPIYGYFEAGGFSTLLLASICDTAVSCNEGTFFVPGLLANMLYLKGTFDKLGIGFDVVRAGKYKDAAEMFVNTGMGPDTRETYELLLDHIFYRICSDWAGNLDIPPDSVESIIDRAVFGAHEAKELGLIDTIVYWSEFIENLIGEDEDRLISITKYTSRKPVWTESDKEIAVVLASGSITSGAGKWSEGITAKRYCKTIRALADDDDISAIVLRVDSPGGSVIASDLIYHELVYAADKKPLIVSMGSVAASGGYYLSMPGDTIFATPYTITGSIGVIMLRPHFEELYSKIGANPQTIKRGKFADIFTGNHPMTAEEIAVFQKVIDESYEQFVIKAAGGRDTTYAWIDSVAQGRVWSSSAAESLALVDNIGSLWDAILLAEKIAKVPEGEHAKFILKPRPHSFLDFAQEFGGAVAKEFLPKTIVAHLATVELAEMLKAKPLYLWTGKVSAE